MMRPASSTGRRVGRHWALCLALTVIGCDHAAGIGAALGDAGSPSGDAVNSPGSGSQTLLVQAVIEAATEGEEDGRYETELRVALSKGGEPMPGATVTIGSAAGQVTLEAGERGSYQGSQDGYHRQYTLAIQAGTDHIDGVRIQGPQPHTFSTPLPGTVHAAGTPLLVTWAPTGATEAAIASEQLPQRTIPDSGRFTIEGQYLAGEAGSSESDRVRLRRANRIAVAGGAAGSSVVVRVHGEVEFFVDATGGGG